MRTAGQDGGGVISWSTAKQVQLHVPELQHELKPDTQFTEQLAPSDNWWCIPPILALPSRTYRHPVR